MAPLLQQATAGLAEVETTSAHGCDAISTRGRPFALVAPDGRIAVRLPDWDLFAAAFELPGSGPLNISDERIGHWVVLPTEVGDDPEALNVWLRCAHDLTAVNV